MKGKLLASAFTGVLVLSGVVTPAGAVSTEPPPVQTGAVFNDPAGTTAEQNRVRDHIVGLINETEKGRLIRASMYALQDPVVSDAFLAAHSRGVNVQLVLDSKFAPHAASQAVINGLGTNKKNRSYVKVCPTNTGCISTVNPSINHNKFFLFSRIGSAQDVLVTASANFTALNTGTYFNNAYTHVGNTGMYLAYRNFWKDQVSGAVRTANYSRAAVSGNLKLYTFPRSSGDPLAEIVSGLGAHDGSGNPTVIRVATPSLARTDVAEALLKQAKKGARIEVAYTAMGVPEKRLLNHPNVHLHHFDRANGAKAVHSKYLTVDGNYAGNPDAKVVWNGSHNLNMSSLIDDDENVLRVIDDRIHDAYSANFDRMLSYASSRS